MFLKEEPRGFQLLRRSEPVILEQKVESTNILSSLLHGGQAKSTFNQIHQTVHCHPQGGSGALTSQGGSGALTSQGGPGSLHLSMASYSGSVNNLGVLGSSINPCSTPGDSSHVPVVLPSSPLPLSSLDPRSLHTPSVGSLGRALPSSPLPISSLHNPKRPSLHSTQVHDPLFGSTGLFFNKKTKCLTKYNAERDSTI